MDITASEASNLQEAPAKEDLYYKDLSSVLSRLPEAATRLYHTYYGTLVSLPAYAEGLLLNPGVRKALIVALKADLAKGGLK